MSFDQFPSLERAMNMTRSIAILIGAVIICTMHTSLGQPLPAYRLSMQNPSVTGSVYQFDLYIQRIGGTPFRLGNSQFVLSFDTADFVNPGISRVASFEEIGIGFFFDHTIAGNEIRISLGGNHIFSSATDIGTTYPGSRIGTYRISGVNVPHLTPDLTWMNSPTVIRTGVSEIDAGDNYRDITDLSGSSHIGGGGELGIIAGTVFEDLNGNGVWEQPAEPGLDGWQVVLHGPAGSSTQVSGSGAWPAGYYEFPNLPAGSYSLAQTVQPGWSLTAFPPSPILLDAGETNIANHFGNYYGPAVTGSVFHDLDGNGVRELTEPGLATWEISATKVGGGGTRYTTTDPLGNYVISFLPSESGVWEIAPAARSGWVQTAPLPPGTYQINVQSGTYEPGKDFGQRFMAGVIGGTVFDDLDGDSAKTVSEPGLSGWSVILMRNGLPADTMMSDAFGAYLFENLPVGAYSVREILIPEWRQTRPAFPGEYNATITPSNAVYTSLDFGNFLPGIIQGFSYYDINHNGAPDPDELGVGNLEIRAQSLSHVFHTFTSISGTWSLSDLPADTYIISEVIPAGFRITDPPAGVYNLSVISGTDLTGLRFGHSASTDTIKFRTFRYDSLAIQYDNRGRFGKSVKRRPDRVEFACVVVNDLPATTGLHIEFSSAVVMYDSSMPLLISPTPVAVFADGRRRKFDIFWADSIDNRDSVTIDGWAMLGRRQRGKYGWQLPGTDRVFQKFSRPVLFTMNALRYPLPNTSNAIDEVFWLRGFSPPEIGMVVGIRRVDAPRTYGWVQIRKPRDLKKSFYDRTGLHTGNPRGFMTLNNGSQFVGMQKQLPPSKHNNRLFAETAAMKFNIEASRLEILPAGLGELIYLDALNPLGGRSIASIISRADSMLTYYDGYREEYFTNMDTTLRKLNNAFSGAIDTLGFATGLRFNGVRSLSDIPFLYADPGTPPVLRPRATEPAGLVPDDCVLFENYPNPFNPTTVVGYSLPVSGFVNLKVYNILGQEVATILDNVLMEEGEGELEFDGSELASGVYFCRLTLNGVPEDEEGSSAQTYTSVRRMILMR